MSEIMKIIDESETQKQKQKKQKKKRKKKKNKGDGTYSKMVRDKWFCSAFKSGFLQLICKASSIFKLNLELALSIILKKREWYESRHVAVECRCLIWDLLSFFICSSILVLQLRQVLPT